MVYREDGSQAAELIKEFGNKSGAIRALASTGDLTVAQIARVMGLRYQHVRNVLDAPLKRKVAEVLEASVDEDGKRTMTVEEAEAQVKKTVMGGGREALPKPKRGRKNGKVVNVPVETYEEMTSNPNFQAEM